MASISACVELVALSQVVAEPPAATADASQPACAISCSIVTSLRLVAYSSTTRLCLTTIRHDAAANWNRVRGQWRWPLTKTRLPSTASGAADHSDRSQPDRGVLLRVKGAADPGRRSEPECSSGKAAARTGAIRFVPRGRRGVTRAGGGDPSAARTRLVDRARRPGDVRVLTRRARTLEARCRSFRSRRPARGSQLERGRRHPAETRIGVRREPIRDGPARLETTSQYSISGPFRGHFPNMPDRRYSERRAFAGLFFDAGGGLRTPTRGL